MPIPIQHTAWVESLRVERPWEDNATTQRLLQCVGDPDIAAVIWALVRSNAIAWITKEMPELDGRNICDALKTSDGEKKVWQVLQAALAWL
jgi:hypothetical protein